MIGSAPALKIGTDKILVHEGRKGSGLNADGARNSINTTQIGNSNTASIGIAGNGNSVSNLQVGVGLSYQVQVTGTSQPISVQQYGRK